jgi:hypothetical protein
MASVTGKTGTDPKITPARTKKACEAIAIGVAFEGAAKYAGIPRDTFWRWMRLGRQDDAPAVYRKFVAAVDDAVSSFEVNCVGKMFGAEDFRAAKALLAMRFPDRYSERRIIEGTVKHEHALKLDLSRYTPDERRMLTDLLRKGQEADAEVLELGPGDIVEEDAA